MTIAVVLFGVLPAYALYLVFANAAGDGLDEKVTDFENAFYPAAKAILRGVNPYAAPDDPQLAAGTEYVYPPLTALAGIPFTAISVEAAGFVVMALLVCVVAATLWVLGIRDWRCYGLALIWPPVLSAVQTGNVTLVLALGAAVVWRYRDDPRVAGASLGVSLAAKLFLWPLVLWLGLTRRLTAAAVAVAVGIVVLLVSWAVIGFAGIGEYPELLRRVSELEEAQGYTLYALALDLGSSENVARALWIALAVASLAGIAVLARRGDEQRAFVVAVAAALACSPIVWLHYFALLLIVVAVAEPRLGPAWFVPLAMYGSTGTLNGSTLQNALTIAAAALTVAVALRPARPNRPPVLAPTVPVGGSP
ncbi:MAG: glycosyltransferase family 87 protein [Gaiellaceae bacterium]